jgi:CRISPR-associated exonuclease Cas4
LYAEDQLLPISALQHLLYCERQCALIHLEQAWSENRFTAEGRNLHEHVHEGGSESRGDTRTATGVRLRSLCLGLTGQADVVEFHRADSATAGDAVPAAATAIPGISGRWGPFPVEYKRGKPKAHQADEVQLCAQALCLEEMLGVTIPAGALFYGATRRRLEVAFTPELRTLVAATAARLHVLLAAGVTPLAEYAKAKCDPCSLLELCQPRISGQRRVADYLRQMLETGP